MTDPAEPTDPPTDGPQTEPAADPTPETAYCVVWLY